jgi:hypothetical protein
VDGQIEAKNNMLGVGSWWSIMIIKNKDPEFTGLTLWN